MTINMTIEEIDSAAQTIREDMIAAYGQCNMRALIYMLDIKEGFLYIDKNGRQKILDIMEVWKDE